MDEELKNESFGNWRKGLDKFGLSGIVSALIEASGPLNILAAQGLYLVDPIFKSSGGHSGIHSLAEVLESRENSLELAAFLRKADQ